jgi:cytochrome c-type biogenesis protein CcmH
MKRLLPALALAASLCALGQSTEVANPDPKVEARLKAVSEELRCLVCQNQTIADSNAPLAVDLRQQVRGMIRDGKSDDDIRAYMVQRYGDFVLYKPPFNAVTALLWVGPGVLIVVGFAVMYLMLRRRRGTAEAAPPTDAARRREIDALLDSGEDNEPKAKTRAQAGP